MIQLLTLALFGCISVAGLFSSNWALSLALSMFAFEQALQASSDIFRGTTWLANAVVGGVCVVSALRMIFMVRRPFLGYFSPIWMGTMLLFAWSVMSLIWTPSAESAGKLMMGAKEYFVLFLIVAPILVDGIESVGKVARAILYGGTLTVMVLVLNPEFRTFSGRMSFEIVSGVKSSPLAIGELGGMLIICASLLRQGPNQALLTVARVGAFLAGAVLALQSGSRGQLVFAVLVALIFYPISKKLKSLPAFVGTAVGLAVIAPSVFFVGQAVLLTEGANRWDVGQLLQGLNARLANIFDMFGEFLRYPPAWVFGLGYNAFSSISATTASEGYVHNIVAELICEFGIPMTIVFGLMVAATARSSIWLFRRYADDPVSRASLSVLLALCAYQLLLINKQGSLWGDFVVFLYMMLIARLHKRVVADDEEEAEYAAGRRDDEPQLVYG